VVLSRPDLHEELCKLLRGPEGKRAAEALGFDSSEVSRFLSGQRGLLKDQINKAIELCGMVVVSVPYLNSICHLASTGIACECARNGMGECGRR